MLYHNSYDTFADCFVSTVDALGESPIVEVKGVKTRELLNYHAVVRQGMSRNFILPHRHDNPFAKMFESLWVLSGRNDIGLLKTYLPRAANFSDDGHTWRAGYGPRLRSWKKPIVKSHYTSGAIVGVNLMSYEGIDQLQNIHDALKADPYTRQAVATIWNPAEDWVTSKDIPCNNWLHFVQRNGKLHLNVSVRSNDVWWGFSGINFYEWSFILQVMAHSLGFEVGEISWNATSMHMYERHWAQAQNMVERVDDYPCDRLSNFSKLNVEPWLDFQSSIDVADGMLGELTYVQLAPYSHNVNYDFTKGYLFKSMKFWLHAYMLIELTRECKYREDDLVDWFETCMPFATSSDQSVTCVAYLNRQLPKTNLTCTPRLLEIINNALPEVHAFIKDVNMSII